MISLSIHNFGCRVNQAEALLWADEFQEKGIRLEKDFQQSDFVLINSCTLTHRSDRDVKKFIKRVSRSNPKARVIVTGCLVEGAYEDLQALPQTWRLFRNTDKNDLAARVVSMIRPQEKPLPRVNFRSRALLKIQDGCNFQCTFCIIPTVRGKSSSLPLKEIIAQGKKFVSQGYKEIVLTGVHICSYGRDLKSRGNFRGLLQEMEKIEGLRKIRLSSLDPRFLSGPMLEHIAASSKICPHFHLSLQYGADDILARMGRKIKVADYHRILAYLRKNSPQASLGADIIIGFPGESEEDFEATYHFLEKSPLTYFHVFPYSPRPGTAASSWLQTDENVKKRRASLLRKLSRQKNLNFRCQFLERELDGIVIKKDKDGAEILTYNYFKVAAPRCSSEEREEVRVKIKKASQKETIGVMASS
ncbi:MAG: tRNA (N(6)-L-threonylcarbamoyladenosine(37)-C(2))-methylthiotransferase MtaB [Candidatus Aminicenantes bacterium]|nr:tRNA (N(6)-L-threonylcarbamoyladenosine(37)-C(2))-methylthiotransferase MtaB [Candidatus Aminicenantes bacterium]